MANRIILDPGKFQGEHVSIPYFWDAVLGGCPDEEIYIGETLYSFVHITDDDRAKFPDLVEYGIMLWERSDGFICSEWYVTKAEYDAAVAEYQNEEMAESDEETDEDEE